MDIISSNAFSLSTTLASTKNTPLFFILFVRKMVDFVFTSFLAFDDTISFKGIFSPKLESKLELDLESENDSSDESESSSLKLSFSFFLFWDFFGTTWAFPLSFFLLLTRASSSLFATNLVLLLKRVEDLETYLVAFLTKISSIISPKTLSLRTFLITWVPGSTILMKN